MLSERLKTTVEEYERELLESRINSLEGLVALIKVGGTTPVERNELYDRIEDAVQAVKAGYSDGVVTGGKNLYKLTGFKFFSYLPETDILVPVKVLHCALKNASSVANQISQLGSIVLPQYLWKKD